MSVLSNNVCEIISDPKGIEISQKTNPRLYTKVYFKDSILRFFPFGEIFLNDKQGMINSTYTLFEGMKFNTKIGAPEEKLKNGKTIGGYLQHTYAWSEDQINDTVRDVEYLSGTNSLIVISDYYFKDFVNPTAYKQQPSSIAQTIANDVFEIADQNKIHIDQTNNDLNHIWYQGNRTSRHFLEKTLVQKAYGSRINNFDKVPFVSFVNCAGDFYFCSYSTLFNQSPVATYEMILSTDKLIQPFAIQDISFIAGGAPLNKDKYNQIINTLKDDGSFLEEEVLLNNKILKIDTRLDKYPVLKENTTKPTSIKNFGLYEEKDYDIIEAQKTFDYQNSCLAYRLDVVIMFNPKAVSGNVVEIKIKDFLKQDQYSSTLSGNWLIVESEHYMDIDAAIYSHLTLAKPSITFTPNWPYSAVVLD